MDGARPLRRFGVLARRWVSCDFADVELFVRPRNRARGEKFGPRARSIFFVNAVRAPHPRGGVRIRRMVGYNGGRVP